MNVIKRAKYQNLYFKFKNSKFRFIIWPIRSFELNKFTPIAILLFTLLLNQNIVRSLKDSLIITLVGAEIINFIKLWGEMPLGVLFVIVYSKMCNVMSTEKAFRIILSFFLIFYFIFGFIIYPNTEYFHPSPTLIKHYISLYPHFKWFIVMWGVWSYSLIYIMAELWPVIVFSVLFWQLANKITKTEEASRFYPFFSIFGQANCLIAGSVVIYFSSSYHFIYPLFAHLGDSSEIMIKSNVVVVLFFGIISLFVHKYIEKNLVLKNNLSLASTKKQDKLELGVIESFKMIMKSRYLLCISILLISYSFSINLIEGISLFKARQLFPTINEFMAYQGRVLFWTGVLTIMFAFIGSTLVNRLGWLSAAIITPIAMLSGGFVFFSVIVFKGHFTFIENLFHIKPLVFIVIVSALQLILCKGAKYSLFDATKEMAYIPLNNEEKTKGKAAVDILGAKIGKASGSVIQTLIFSILPFATYDDIAFVLMIIFVLVCFAWIIGVKMISTMYNKKVIVVE